MAENISQSKPRRPLGRILVVAGLVLVAVLAFVLGGQMARQQDAETVATPAAVLTLSPESSATPAPTCAGGEVEAVLQSGASAQCAGVQAAGAGGGRAEAPLLNPAHPTFTKPRSTPMTFEA